MDLYQEFSGTNCFYCRQRRPCPLMQPTGCCRSGPPAQHRRRGVLGGTVEMGESPRTPAVSETREEIRADIDLVRLPEVLGGPELEVSDPNGESPLSRPPWASASSPPPCSATAPIP